MRSIYFRNDRRFGMIRKRNFFFASLVFLLGVGGLLGYDLYYKPYVLAQPVLKIKVSNGQYLPKNYQIQKSDIYLDSVETKDIPADAITNYDDVINKIANVNLTDGMILTRSLVDLNDLEPKENEGIYPIPKDAIYAINGSLRSRDKVNIYIVSESATKINGNVDDPIVPEEEDAIFKGITVTYVRTEDNNDVLDTEKGNTNKRLTSTGKVSYPELKMTNEDGQVLKGYLEQGKKLWIVRVE